MYAYIGKDRDDLIVFLNLLAVMCVAWHEDNNITFRDFCKVLIFSSPPNALDSNFCVVLSPWVWVFPCKYFDDQISTFIISNI